MTYDASGQQILATGQGASGTIVAYALKAGESVVGAGLSLTNGIVPSGNLAVTVYQNGTISLGTLTLMGYGGNFDGTINGYVHAAREYLIACAGTFVVGDVISFVITAGTVPVGTTLTATLYGAWPAQPLAIPRVLGHFRPHHLEGLTKANVPPTTPAYVMHSSNIYGDTLCASQDSSGVTLDPATGTLYFALAVYNYDYSHQSVPGSGGATRAYGYKLPVGAPSWTPLGIVQDILLAPDPLTGLLDQTCSVDGPAYFFDPITGKYYLFFTTSDGGNSTPNINNYTINSIKIASATSFDGPWGTPFTLLTNLRSQHPCTQAISIVPRPATNDYALVVRGNQGFNNRDVRIVILPNLATAVSTATWQATTPVLLNNEEGGGLFVRGDRLYCAGYQIFSSNEAGSRTSLWSAPLASCDNPGTWRVEEGAWWNVDLFDANQSGGRSGNNTCVTYSPLTDEALLVQNVWDQRTGLNSIAFGRVPWAQMHRAASTALLNAPNATLIGAQGTCAILEIPVLATSSLTVTITPDSGVAQTAFGIMLNGDTANGSAWNTYGVCVDVGTSTTRLCTSDSNGNLSTLVSMSTPTAVNGAWTVMLAQTGVGTYNATVNGQQLSATVGDPTLLSRLFSSSVRWKTYVARTGQVTLSAMQLAQAGVGTPAVGANSQAATRATATPFGVCQLSNSAPAA